LLIWSSIKSILIYLEVNH